MCRRTDECKCKKEKIGGSKVNRGEGKIVAKSMGKRSLTEGGIKGNRLEKTGKEEEKRKRRSNREGEERNVEMARTGGRKGQ